MKFFLFVIISILLYLYRPTELDSKIFSKSSFNDLPQKVRKVYIEYCEKFHPNDKNRFDTISLDLEYDLYYTYTGIDNGLISMILWGHNHHFYINGIHFKLKANKGKPFILFEKNLYFPNEFTLNSRSLKKTVYSVIDLTRKI